MLFFRSHRHTFPRISIPRGGIHFSRGGGQCPPLGGGGAVKYPVQLPDLDELHDSSQDNPSTTTSSSEVEPNSLPQSMCLAAVPFLTQKSKTKLYFQNHTFTKKYDQKTSTIWRCSSRKCKGSIKTTPSTYEVIDATPHTCSPLTDYEYNILLSENDIVNDTSSSSTVDLANACHHPYSKTLYKRRWRKTRTSSSSSV